VIISKFKKSTEIKKDTLGETKDNPDAVIKVKGQEKKKTQTDDEEQSPDECKSKRKLNGERGEPITTLQSKKDITRQAESETNQENGKQNSKILGDSVAEKKNMASASIGNPGKPIKVERRETNSKPSSKKNIAAVVEEEVYNIEALMEKKGSKFLVKWENYPEDQNTWEPQCLIPDLIIKFYEDDFSRLGKPIPADFEKVEEEANINLDADDDNWEPDATKDVSNEKPQTNHEKVPKKVDTKGKNKQRKQKENKVGSDENNGKTIEALMMKNGSKYLIKWKNVSDDENTWEHKTSIPKNVLKFYENDLARLGTPAPNI